MADGVGTTHQVRIGAHHYLVKPGSYRKRQAPLFGPRFTTGDPDWNNLSMWQHWVQRTWIGGFDASEWQDEAMFDKSAGVDTSYHDVLLLARDIGPDNATRSGVQNWDLEDGPSGSTYIREFFTWNGQDNAGRSDLYCLAYSTTGGYLYRFRQSDTTWVQVKNFAHPVRSWCYHRRRIYFGDTGSNLNIMAGNPGSETFSTVARPAGTDTNYAPYAMYSFRDKMYVAFLNLIWRMDKDGNWDGSTVFYEAPGVDYITDMEEHLGFLYMASHNGHILRTDGNNTFDMWTMEPGSDITNIRSFDGRLFIAVRDPLEGTNASEAVLYQFSGSAVTELKRFGKIGVESSLGRMRTVGGRMFFGAPSLFGFQDGFGIAMYDAVEDSYHVFAVNRDTADYAAGAENTGWIVDDVIWHKGFLYCSVRGHGIFRVRYVVRDVETLQARYNTAPTPGTSSSKNGGWIESSEFDAGTPGLQKLWNAIILDVDLPSTDTTIYVEHSLDGGASWETGTELTKTGTARRYQKIIRLEKSNGGVYSTTFKYRLTLRTDDQTRSPAVRGVIVRYLPVPEPNWVWDMTLVLSDTQELLDGTIQTPNNVTKLSALEDAFRDQQLVFFIDTDGTRWARNGAGDYPGVLIQNLDERVPIITASADGDIEREINISLIEAIENYELGA